MAILPFLLGTKLKLFFLMLLVISIIISNFVANNIHRPNITLENIADLDDSLVAWEKKGSYVKIYGLNVFGIHLKAQLGEHFQNKTVIIVHGFPSSSFEYSYGAAEGLQQLGYDVILHDHVGFGFSDKPFSGFGYSIHDHADVAQAFYDSLQSEIRGPSVFISHDMGDSVLTEMLTRYERNPSVFPSSLIIDNVIFTNGGMYMKEASLRLSQRLLSSRFAEPFSNLASNIDPTGYIASHQLKSVFSASIKEEPPFSSIGKQTTHQIQLLQDLLYFKGGNVILWRLSRYLQDRYACEERWMAGIKKLETRGVPFHFIWGDADSVAPVKIPKLFIEKSNLTSSTLTIIEGRGHFWMLEKGDGDFWAKTMHQAMGGA